MVTPVLCRRDLSDFGEPKKYCCKPIKSQSNFDWCDDCLKRLPFWPKEDAEKKS